MYEDSYSKRIDRICFGPHQVHFEDKTKDPLQYKLKYSKNIPNLNKEILAGISTLLV